MSAPTVQPVVAAAANGPPTPARTPPAITRPAADSEVPLELGGGALAALLLGAGAYAVARRRRAQDEVWEDDYVEADVPADAKSVAQYEPPMVQPYPPAFAWGEPSPQEELVERSSGNRRSGETWVERAYRGPTPDNPSLSLRKRLKRAAFFDQRERDSAADRAAPVEADAGLPERLTEQRELEAA
jgi:hypothetical protein